MNASIKQTSVLAVVSLVSGILGWSLLPFLGSLAAIVPGHLARREIRANPALGGDSLAVVGLVLGWVSVAAWILGILAFLMFFGGLAWLGSR